MDPEALQFIKPMVNVIVHYHKVMRYDLLLIAHQSPIWLYFSVLHFILRDIEVKMAFFVSNIRQILQATKRIV